MPSWMRWTTAVVMSLAAMPVAIAPGQSDHYFQASNSGLPTAANNNVNFQLEELADRVADLESQLKGKVDTGSRPSVILNGRIHGDTWFFPEADGGASQLETRDPEDRLIFRRIRFGVKGNIQDNMEYKIEMEFADANNTQYRDVYVGFNDLPIVQTLLIGNQKRPYGLDHLNSSRYNVFLERPFVVEGFNQDARRLGIAAYSVSDDQAWNWRYGVYNMELTQGDIGYIGDNLQLQFAGRLANTIWYDEYSDGRGYAHWAVSGTWANPDGLENVNNTDTNRNEARFDTRPEGRTSNDWLDTGFITFADHYYLGGLEGVVNLGPMQVVGEYLSNWVSRTGQTDLQFHGAYVYVSYFLTGEHMPWSRSSGTLGRIKPFTNFFLVDTCNDGRQAGWGAWQLAARYSYADFNDQDIFGGYGESFTLGLNWYWNQNARLQFNYITGQITNARAVDLPGDPLVPEANYSILGARFMVDF